MKTQRSLVAVTVLALTTITGIVGMLIAESALWDGVGLALSALPLGYGAWRFWRERDRGT